MQTDTASRPTVHRPWHQRPAAWAAALAGLFAFRLFYGLCYEFFFEDFTQIFLIGLRAYAGGRWPYFGADVVWTQSQIPGALQGLLVAVPMMVAPYPEAPFVLLNALSMAALALLAWYVCLRLPTLPRWLVWGWIMTVPWTINFSTSLINTSYILPGAVVFFVGFFEACPWFSTARLRAWLAVAMMGFGVAWVMQIHMSWPLLLPYAAAVLVVRGSREWRRIPRDVGAFAAGLAVPGILLVPTLVVHGLAAGGGGTGRNLHLHLVNPSELLVTIGRFLAFGSLEVVRFTGTDTAKRVVMVTRHPWIAPLLAVVWLTGIVHPLVMAGLWFRRRHPVRRDWAALRLLVAGSIVIVYAAYFFVMEPPQAHAFYVLSPISMMFAAYCWAFVDGPRWRRVAAAALAVNIVFHAGLALVMGPTRSMYKNRAVVAAAVTEKEPSYFAHRREYAVDAISAIDAGARRDPRDELTITSRRWSIGPARAILWSVTVRNDSRTRAYRDLFHQASYRDASGRVVMARQGYILDVIQPGETRSFEVNDGTADVPFTDAALDVVLAEGLKPLRPSR
jgi:hypothetical protein